MNRYIKKCCLFVSPFFLLYVLNVAFYKQDEGDLVRLGYLYTNPSPKQDTQNRHFISTKFTRTSELDWKGKAEYDIMIIGDSFSEQGDLGFQNYLARKGVSVLHRDSWYSGRNPVQELIELINSGFFRYRHVKYVLLQSVERAFVQRCQHLDFETIIPQNTLVEKNVGHRPESIDRSMTFFSDALFKIPLTNIQYCFSDKPTYSKTYRFKSNKYNLFSNNAGHLLFYEDDIKFIHIKNDTLKISKCISELNKINRMLSKIDIKLMTLVSPDKYDLYYTYISDKRGLVRPDFFQIYGDAAKEYIDVGIYDVLSAKLRTEKNVYYYDDTHWSPVGASIVADAIYDSMLLQQ